MTKTRIKPEKSGPKTSKTTTISNKIAKSHQKKNSNTVTRPGSSKSADWTAYRKGTVGNFSVLKTLGAGSSSTVQLAVDDSTNRMVALKILKPKESSRQEQATVLWKNEVEAGQRMDSKHVTKYYQFEESAVYESIDGQ